MSLINTKFHKVDTDTNGVVTIGEIHRKIHSGGLQSISYYASSIGVTSGIQYYFKTGAREAHLLVSVVANADLKVTLHASITVTATNTGSILAGYNRNRNSSTVFSSVAYHSGTITASGTIIDTHYLPSGAGKFNSGVGDAGRNEEWELKANTDYMIWLSPIASVAITLMKLDFYETD